MDTSVEAALLELGAVIIGLAILARLAGRLSIPAIPLYLVAGLAFGEGGALPLVTTESFIRIGAEIGLILLLFMLGLEYSATELVGALRRSADAGMTDLAANFVPGFVAGLLLGWGPVAATFLGGATYVSSSGVAAKLIADFGRAGRPESRLVTTILILEDLAMAVFLPLLAVIILGGSPLRAGLTAAGAVLGVAIFLWGVRRLNIGLSRIVFSHSDEALLLSILGFGLVMAGAAELLEVSAAVGALLAGIALSGPAARGALTLLAPVRDLFAAIFFAFIGVSIDPATIPGVLGTAVVLAAVTAITKVASAWRAASRAGINPRGRLEVGAMLVARGEFSLAIAGLSVAANVRPQPAPLIATYVVIMAVLGPVLSRIVDRGVRPQREVR